jgi:hypothetical protein
MRQLFCGSDSEAIIQSRETVDKKRIPKLNYSASYVVESDSIDMMQEAELPTSKTIVMAIPFDGDPELFFCRLPSFNGSLPMGEIIGSELHISIDLEKDLRLTELAIKSTNDCLESLQRMSDELNSTPKSRTKTAVA